jgi:hypothetical protein
LQPFNRQFLLKTEKLSRMRRARLPPTVKACALHINAAAALGWTGLFNSLSDLKRTTLALKAGFDALWLNHDQQDALAKTLESPSPGILLCGRRGRISQYHPGPGGIYWSKRLARAGESDG